MSRIPISSEMGVVGSRSTSSLTSAIDMASWQTALAAAGKNKGPLTPAVFSTVDGQHINPPAGYQVKQYGHDDNTGTGDPYDAATAIAAFGDRTGPQGIVFLDRATNTVTLTHVNPLTGRPDSEPETVKEVGDNLVIRPGLKDAEPAVNLINGGLVQLIVLNMDNAVVAIEDDLDGYGNAVHGNQGQYQYAARIIR